MTAKAWEQLWCIICSSAGLWTSFLHEMERDTEMPKSVKARGRKETRGEVLWWLPSLGLTALPLGCVERLRSSSSRSSYLRDSAWPTPSRQHGRLCLSVQHSKLRPDLSTGTDRPSAPQSSGPCPWPTGSRCSSHPEIKLRCAIWMDSLSGTDGICCPGVSPAQLLLLQYLAQGDRQQLPIVGA